MTLITLVLAEAALRIALPASDFLQVTLIGDPHLRFHIAPHDTGHDANGLRNASVPQQADIVALGDSLTYGINAPAHASWPGHLKTILNTETYNMGLGGYGPLQYLYLMQKEVPKYKPKVAIVAIYMGNDMMDTFSLTQHESYWHPYRLSARTGSGVTEFDRVGLRDWDQAQSGRFLGGLRDWLSHHSMAYSVFRAVVLSPIAAKLKAPSTPSADPSVLMPWISQTTGQLVTVFTSGARITAMDPALPEAEEGIRIAERALRETQAAAASNGHRLVIAILPTKERVYCAALKAAQAKLPPAHIRLCEVEPQVVKRLMETARAAGAVVVDTSPALERAALRGEAIYPPTDDGHPISAGYKIMATEIAAAIGQP